jgi:poly(ADP-ribose) glycohydrolase ARH3
MTSQDLLQSKFQAAMLGCFIGDALGAPYEGASPQDRAVERDLKRRTNSDGTWTYTDDTEMMIGVAESIVRCGAVVAEDILRTMANAFEPARGYGKGTRLTFEAYLRGTDARRAAFVTWREGSRGNGAAVRVVPVACLYHDDTSMLEVMAEESAGITHAHPVGRAGSVLQANALAQALVLDPVGHFDKSAYLARLADTIVERDASLAEKLSIAVRLVANPPPAREVVALLGSGVLADESVPLAIYLFVVGYPSFQGAIMSAIEHGGDTDTVAAMCGSLMGAAMGVQAISSEWLARLENGPRGRDHVVHLAADLHRLWWERRRNLVSRY